MKGYELKDIEAEDGSLPFDSVNEDAPEVANNKRPKNNVINIFKALEVFSKEGMLSKADKKELSKFERNIHLETKLMEQDLDYADLSDAEKIDVMKYFKLITKITPKLDGMDAKRVDALTRKYANENGTTKPFKKKRFRDIKKDIKKKDAVPADVKYLTDDEEYDLKHS